jgi:hypothetical protein
MKEVRKIGYVMAFLLVCNNVTGQNLGFCARVSNDWDTSSVTISTTSFGHYGSTFFNGKMVNILRFGGFIDEDLKLETIDRLNKGNQLGIAGGEFRSTWEFQDPTPRLLKKYGYYALVEVGGLAGGLAAKDLVPFVLNGSANYVGDTAFFAPTEMVNYSYQKLGVGINQNNRLKVGVSLLNFSQFTYGRIENGYIAVADSFDQMTMVARGNYVQRDSAMTSFFNRAGVGLGLDMEVRIPLRPIDSLVEQSTPHFVVGFKNLGAFISNRNTLAYNLRTNSTFSGFEVNSLQQFETSLFSLNSLADTLKLVADVGRQVTMLPFELYFYMPTLVDGKRIQPVAGFRYINRSVMRAMGYLGAEWRSVNNQTLISSYFTAGGFTRFQWGMSLRHDFGAVQIGIVSNNLLGWVTKEAYGKSLGVSVNYKLSCGTKDLKD